PGARYRAGNDHAHGRAAQCGGVDHRPDRSVGGAGYSGRAQRQSQETRRGDVRRIERPEREPPHGAVRGALRPRRQGEGARGLQLKLMSAPGPANLNTAKGILAKVGLKDGDYTIDQLDMGQHINAMKAGTFDGGYTLEPNASVMNQLGFAKTVEAGVIAKY